MTASRSAGASDPSNKGNHGEQRSYEGLSRPVELSVIAVLEPFNVGLCNFASEEARGKREPDQRPDISGLGGSEEPGSRRLVPEHVVDDLQHSNRKRSEKPAQWQKMHAVVLT